MKPLEQMNIMDDFLAGSLIGHKKYGEAASRYILLIADNPETHGIRMDVYLDEEDGEIFDIEPDNNVASDIDELLRRTRFYHVKQDGEVGIAYMKSFEIEEKIRREGEERGREEGMHGMIRTCRRFKQTDAQIVQLLQEELNLTREQAEDALAKYTQASDEKVTQ
ncbi:MAG: hypothetical protein MRZ64_08370 [[Bacteroides] pectinophilus]|nr:hypothetical protein [[Bacteroides] pectinophilus]